jgi:tetratricopeptide (TPR) repeat protein
MTRFVTFACLTLALLLCGCEEQETAPASRLPTGSGQTSTVNATTATTQAPDVTEPASDISAPQETTLLLQEATTLRRYEVPSQALLSWYALREVRPALLIYANDPLLQTITPSMQKNLMEQLAKGNESALVLSSANIAILPKMTLEAALQAGLFSAVYWVMPVNVEMAELSIDIFRTQMIQLGAMDDEEARQLTLRDGVFSGTVDGVPFHALHPQADFAVSGPAVFHFDLSYLAPLYQGEIKSQVFPLIYQTLKHLREQRVDTISAGFSYSQLSGEIPLGSRFVGDIFAQLFKEPQLLDENLPQSWQQRSNALYLPELFNTSDARNTLLQLLATEPEDPSVHYALYSISRQVRSARHSALGHLADAVRRDQVYALEYLKLAPVAREKGHPDEALRMLRLANEASPDNPFITLELARALVTAGQGENAAPLLRQLRNLKWSKIFYPDMPAFLEQLLTESGG